MLNLSHSATISFYSSYYFSRRKRLSLHAED
jgi:hypothetical protein